MADIATLGIAVESASAAKAAGDLDRLTGSAVRAEGAADGLADAGKRVGAAADGQAAATARATVTSRLHTVALQAEADAARLSSFNMRNLNFQLIDIAQSIPLAFQSPTYFLLNFANQSAQIGQIYMGNGGLKAAFRDIGGVLGNLVSKFAPLMVLVGLITAAFGGLTYEINKTAKTQVSFGNVFMATIQTAAGAIAQFFKPAIDSLGTWFGQFIDWIAPAFKTAINGIIGSFVFAFTAVKDTWSLLPSAMGDIVLQSVNNVISGVQGMINSTIGLINELIDKVNGISGAVGLTLGKIGSVNFGGGIANPYAGAANKVGGVIGADAQSAFGTDYAGSAFDAVSKRAQALALADATTKAGSSAKAANDNFKSLAHEGMSEAEKAAQKLAQTVERTLGSALGSLFSGPITSLQDGLDKVLSSFGQLGQQNLSNVFSGMFGQAANDNGVTGGGIAAGASVIGKAVRDGAKDGTSSGFGDLLKNIPGGAGTVSAGLGGLGMGYQTQNPLLGGLGGAASGFMAGGPWGAVIGGIAGVVGGLFGMNEALEKSKAALNEQRQTVELFIKSSDAKPVDQYTQAVMAYEAQAREFKKLAQAAGDTALVQRLHDAAVAYKENLRAQMDAAAETEKTQKFRDRVDAAKSQLSDAYQREADVLGGVIERTRAFIDTIGDFRESLKLDKQYSTLNPEGMLAEARKQFDLTLKKAKLGDADAQGRLQGASTSYLDAARGYFGSTQGYSRIFNQVESALGGAMGSAQTRLSGAEKQLAATNRSIKALSDIHSATVSVVQGLHLLQRLAVASEKLRGEDAKELIATMKALDKKLGKASVKKQLSATG